MAKILDGYSISGNFTFATGRLRDAVVFADRRLRSRRARAVRCGRTGSPGQSITGPQTHLEWFNTAAFVAAPLDAKGNPDYGNASRNSIELPGTVSLSGSLSRTISFGETRSMEMRLNANNALNTVQYSGVGTHHQQPADLRLGDLGGGDAVVYL